MKWYAPLLMMIAIVLASGCARSTLVADVAPPEQPGIVEAEAVALPVVTVHKSPTCGCCNGWIEHMEEHGFEIEARDTDNLTAIKAENSVPAALQSCHTAIIGDYVIEGHVPAEDIQRLLAEQPAVAGLAVPGMPIGSPGMEIDGVDAQPFQTVAFDSAGGIDVFAEHDE